MQWDGMMLLHLLLIDVTTELALLGIYLEATTNGVVRVSVIS